MTDEKKPLDGILKDEKARSLLESREARALADALQRLGGEDLKGAARAAAAGDGSALRSLLSRVMADPEGAKAVEALKKKTGG